MLFIWLEKRNVFNGKKLNGVKIKKSRFDAVWLRREAWFEKFIQELSRSVSTCNSTYTSCYNT